MTSYDLAIIGAGINGAGIARDAAGQGLSVLLIDAGDIGGATSSASTKLIHGGLRYLEMYDFRLVHEALKERDILLSLAPHIIWPMRFTLPHVVGMRPEWLIRTGLFIYDHLGGKSSLPRSRTTPLDTGDWQGSFLPSLTRGFTYSDCWVQDHRLVLLNAQDACAHGATLKLHTRCTHAQAQDDLWQLTLSQQDGSEEHAKARYLVNATGPWAASFLKDVTQHEDPPTMRLIQGSHIIVPKQWNHDHAMLLQQPDGRVVFATPYEDEFTLIGTTDTELERMPPQPQLYSSEQDYLIRAYNSFANHPITASDIVWHYSGVRPLVEDGANNASAISRDYVLEEDRSHGAPLLSIFGGKITTYRKLSEAALAPICQFFQKPQKHWTASSPLPGAPTSPNEKEAFLKNHSNIAAETLAHLWRHYGTASQAILSQGDLGKHLGGTFYEAELDYLRTHEWAQSIDDVLWRRTKHGLRLDHQQYEMLSRTL